MQRVEENHRLKAVLESWSYALFLKATAIQ